VRTVYARGDSIPEEQRIAHSGAALLKYWLLQADGSPCPETRPYARRSDIVRAHEETGLPYEILSNRRGRPSADRDHGEWRRAYDKEYWARESTREANRERMRRVRGAKRSEHQG
jgi:hypothetical protein